MLIYPHTESRRVALRPATAADQANFTGTLLRTGLESFRPAADPTRALARICAAAFMVTWVNSTEVLGFATLHGLDPAGHIKCGIYLDPKRARLGIGSDVIHLTVNYAFATFNVDKVISQTTQASFGAFGLSADEGTEVNKGVLPGHLYFRGKPWDLYNFEIQRREWTEYIQRNEDGILAPPLTWCSAPTGHARTPDAFAGR